MKIAILTGAVGLLGVLAAPQAVRAAPIDRTITVQPIDVCSTDNSICANGDGLLGSTIDATRAIWAQAGIGIALLPTEHFDDSAYLTTTVDLSATTDQARQLMRLPGHGQSPNPQVLNMYFVQNLAETPTSTQTVYAFSFTNGNGMIIGPNPRIDTIAHEIGHNVGLDHHTFGAGDPSNLMTDGAYRSVPTSLSQITSGQTDQLNAAQIAQARAPLFSVGQLSETLAIERFITSSPTVPFTELRNPNGFFSRGETYSPTAYPNLTGTTDPTELFSGFDKIAPPGALPAEALVGVRIRFLPGTPVVTDPSYPALTGFIFTTGPSLQAAGYACDPVYGCIGRGPFYNYFVHGTRSVLADGTIEFAWSLNDPSAVFDTTTVNCPDASGVGCTSAEAPGTPASIVPFGPYDDFYAYFFPPGATLANPGTTPAPLPFSAAFVYSDGLTTQGFYDAATGLISTTRPYDLSYAPGTGPAIEPGFVAPEPTGFAIEVATEVPEPASASLLALALLALGAASRRRRAAAAPAAPALA